MLFRFLDFPVYKLAKEFNKEINEICKSLPPDEKYILNSQLRRASISIILNIAEGSDKGSDKDFNRYLMNSLGSLNETVAGLDIALDRGYISKVVFDKLFEKATELSNQIAGFSRKLKNS